MLMRICWPSVHLLSQATDLLYPGDKARTFVSYAMGGGPPTHVGAYMRTQRALAIASREPTALLIKLALFVSHATGIPHTYVDASMQSQLVLALARHGPTTSQ